MCALLAKPALNQTIAIIQKYQAAAINFVNSALPVISEFHKGPKIRTAMPWLTVAYEGTVFREESQQTREQHLGVIVALESGNFDSELAQEQAIDFLRVLDYIFTTLSPGPASSGQPPQFFTDWETALAIQHETVPDGTKTTPWPQGTVKQVFIEREEQSLVMRPNMDLPIIEVSLHLRFDLEEL